MVSRRVGPRPRTTAVAAAVLLLLLVLSSSSSVDGRPDRDRDDNALDFDRFDYSYGRSCIRPYRKIGRQCLFFSRPEPAWDIGEGWGDAYLSFYDAVAMCRKHGGDLARKVDDFPAALRHCSSSRGGCAPSLLWRGDKCFQWSPLDGSEVEVPCRRWEVTMRFICEMKDFDKKRRRKK